MNAEKYTEKSLEPIRSAQTVSKEYGSQQIETEHLLLALLTQEGGLIPELLAKMGQDVPSLIGQTEELCGRLPRVSGNMSDLSNIYVSRNVEQILLNAEKTADNMKDDYVSVEHVMLSLLENATGNTAQMLQRNGITKDGFLKVLSEVRGAT